MAGGEGEVRGDRGGVEEGDFGGNVKEGILVVRGKEGNSLCAGSLAESLSHCQVKTGMPRND